MLKALVGSLSFGDLVFGVQVGTLRTRRVGT